MANRISLVWQTKGGVDHINDLRYVHSLRKECAIIKAKEDVKKNIKIMNYIHKCGQKSQYDRQAAMDDYDRSGQLIMLLNFLFVDVSLL